MKCFIRFCHTFYELISPNSSRVISKIQRMTSATQPKVDNKGLGAILCGHSSLSPPPSPNSLCLPSYHSWTTPHPLHLQRRATLPLSLINQDFLLSGPDNPAVTARAFLIRPRCPLRSPMPLKAKHDECRNSTAI